VGNKLKLSIDCLTVTILLNKNDIINFCFDVTYYEIAVFQSDVILDATYMTVFQSQITCILFYIPACTLHAVAYVIKLMILFSFLIIKLHTDIITGLFKFNKI